MIYAVVPAAGVGSRMGRLTASCSKSLLKISDELSILELTLLALADSGCFDGIVVVAQESEIPEINGFIDRCCANTSSKVVVGGDSRQESVYIGLSALESCDYVAIHDAARPFCSPKDIQAVLAAAKRHNAAILATPVSSTIKKSMDGKVVKETVLRSELWEAQTPQVFAYELILEAHDRARAERYVGTDDSELVERLGKSVVLVEATSVNIKITRVEDLQIANALLYKQSRESV